MVLRVLLGLFLNIVVALFSIAFIIIIPMLFLFVGLIFGFDFPQMDAITYLIIVILIELVPFFALNIPFSISTNRKMKVLNYDKNKMMRVNIIYWVVSTVLFFFWVISGILPYVPEFT